jgi:hypothetical protein
VAVNFEPRDEPCALCGAPTAVKVIIRSEPSDGSLQRRHPIHDDDGTPADHLCRRAARVADAEADTKPLGRLRRNPVAALGRSAGSSASARGTAVGGPRNVRTDGD